MVSVSTGISMYSVSTPFILLIQLLLYIPYFIYNKQNFCYDSSNSYPFFDISMVRYTRQSLVVLKTIQEESPDS